MDAPGFLQVTLGGLLGSSIATAALGALLLKWSKTVESEIKAHFDQKLAVFASTREWKRQALAELFGPLCMHFERTKAAFDRWDKKNLFLEAQVVRHGNQTIRDLLLAKGHLIPGSLVPAATKLVVHYDVWLEQFARVRDAEAPSDASFVFAGPAGYPFPKDAERAFVDAFHRLQHELYAVEGYVGSRTSTSTPSLSTDPGNATAPPDASAWPSSTQASSPDRSSR